MRVESTKSGLDHVDPSRRDTNHASFVIVHLQQTFFLEVSNHATCFSVICADAGADLQSLDEVADATVDFII